MAERTNNGQELILLVDGSVDPRTKVGYGAYLFVYATENLLEGIRSQVKVRRFVSTSATRLELQVLLWALGKLEPTSRPLKIYTDSQNIIGLPQRREQLEQNNYCAKSGRQLNNADLYHEFYRQTDRFDCEFVKLTGHLPGKQKTQIDRLFSLVDKASRRALRDNRD